jgi:uncharacterized membrane protein YbhN (UPF0104 family)
LRQRRSALGWREWAATGITLACLVWLGLNAQLPSLQEAAGRASYGPLGVALCLSLLAVVCKAARWRALYPPLVRPKLGLAIAGVAVGQVANWAIPARLGEAVRVGLVSSAGIAPVVGAARTVSLSIGVLVAEKLLDGGMLLAMVAVLALFGGLPGWLSTMGLLLVASASACGLALAILLKNWQGQPEAAWSRDGIARLTRRLPQTVANLLEHLKSVADGISAWLSPRASMQALVWSAAAWGLGAMVNYFVLSSLDLHVGLGPALAVLVALMGGAVIPSLPGRVGVFQYLCVLALLPFGLGFDQALAFSLALYAVVYLPPIMIGLLSAVLVGSSPRQLAASLAGAAGTKPSRNG